MPWIQALCTAVGSQHLRAPCCLSLLAFFRVFCFIQLWWRLHGHKDPPLKTKTPYTRQPSSVEPEHLHGRDSTWWIDKCLTAIYEFATVFFFYLQAAQLAYCAAGLRLIFLRFAHPASCFRVSAPGCALLVNRYRSEHCFLEATHTAVFLEGCVRSGRREYEELLGFFEGLLSYMCSA